MNSALYAVIFYTLGFMMLTGAILLVGSRNLVHASVAMFVSMVSVAGLFVLLDAEFLAMAQVLIYAGAATVLILFVVMITAKKIDQPHLWFNAQADISALFVGILSLGLIMLLISADWEVVDKAATKSTAALAQVLFNRYALPFEVASVVLLIALIGAIVLARGEEDD